MSIKVAGFGGQGVLLLGQLLAEMGMREGLDVSWLPSYGPEMRSGSAHCYVTLAHQRVSTPVASHPDVLLAMNEISLRKFAAEMRPGSLIIYNHDRVPEDFAAPEGVQVGCVPASNIADGLGATKAANIVLLGALLAETGAMPAAVAEQVIASSIKNTKLLDINRKALEAGQQFIATQRWMKAVSQPDGFAG
jgi:2-oxoisovalerate ferredoxin oxidoreductase beta subunit